MARSLNRAQLIGNLTRDPELRYTPNGTAVCSFGLATNRSWKTETGEKREEADFHNIVAWNKLAELCSQFLVKGRKVYVEGRLSTRSWTGQDGAHKTRTEIVISDMILLDSKRPDVEALATKEDVAPQEVAAPTNTQVSQTTVPAQTKSDGKSKTQKKIEKKDVPPKKGEEPSTDEVVPEDIPF